LATNYLEIRRRHLFVTHLAANAASYNITNSASALLPAAQEGQWPLQFGRVDFNPVSGNQDEEFIQLTNPHPVSVDLSGWRLAGGVSHSFAPGTVLVAGGSLYLSPNVNAFRARALSPHGGEGHFIQGNYRGSLSARGESLALMEASGATNATFNYEGAPSLAQQYLRITELMFNPVRIEGNTNDAQEFEFIELRNVSTNTPLELAGVRFVDGVQFNFSTGAVATLAPGQFVLVVENLGAFAGRYGDALPVAGQYAGNLANDRERLRLVDASGENILDFDFEADWHKSADGRGHSLVTADELGVHTAWNHKAGWRPSACPGGSPAAADPIAPCDADGDGLPDYWELDWVIDLAVLGGGGDADNDGVSDAEEYARGTDPGDPNNPPRLSLTPESPTGLILRFPEKDGRVYVIDSSPNLTGWQPLLTNTVTAGEIRIPIAATNGLAAYFRARWQP
jgi:hypothetical protein